MNDKEISRALWRDAEEVTYWARRLMDCEPDRINHHRYLMRKLSAAKDRLESRRQWLKDHPVA